MQKKQALEKVCDSCNPRIWFVVEHTFHVGHFIATCGTRWRNETWPKLRMLAWKSESKSRDHRVFFWGMAQKLGINGQFMIFMCSKPSFFWWRILNRNPSRVVVSCKSLWGEKARFSCKSLDTLNGSVRSACPFQQMLVQFMFNELHWKKTGPENDYIGVRLLGSSVKSTVGMGQFNRMARNSNSGLTQAQHDPKQSAEAGADGVVSEFWTP